MFRNYLKTAWRSMRRNKVNSVINIAGLAVAMTAVILIVMYVTDELGYDRFFTDDSRIFQVNMTTTDNGTESTTGGNTAPAVGPTLTSMYPEIEAYARIYRPGDALVRYASNGTTSAFFTEKRVLAVDSNFLQVFDFPLKSGNAAACLERPDAVVVTAAAAKKYFGNADPIGKTLLFDTSKKPFIVTAVLKDLPHQSSFQFDLLVPIRAYAEVKKRSWNWFWLQVNTYVRLKPSVAADRNSLAALETKFPSMVKAHAFDQKRGQSYEDFVKKGGKLAYTLMPFREVHLYAAPRQVPARLKTLGNISYVYIFSIIAFFIIILACVNFMNLSTAQAATRAKEVGVRKVMGSMKGQLVRQFVTEAMVYSFAGVFIAIGLVCLLLGPFNAVAGKQLYFGMMFSTGLWMILPALAIGSGLLASVYPALYLTSFNAVEVLRGLKLFKGNAGNLVIRNGSVVFQFAVSIALIICTVIVFQQLNYTRSKDLGLGKENVLVIANTKRLGVHEETMRAELMKVNGVIDASATTGIPTKGSFGDSYNPEATQTDKPLMNEIGLSSFMADDEFVSAMKMQLAAGRNFSKSFNDSASVLINETAAKQIGWKDPVGKFLAYPGNQQRFKVIGVVRDFNTSSLHDQIEPFALFNSASKTYYMNSSYIVVRLKAGDPGKYLAAIEAKWKSFAPDLPFDYSFLDEEFDALYGSEQRMGVVFSIFTGLSIFVACLGLFGLSIYTAERRRKEIGVRKVLGASVPDTVALLSQDFLKLVLIAAVLASPVAWLAMHKWLEDFAYRIRIDWGVFVLSSAAALIISLLTVSFHAIRAALANPVKSLRTE